MQSQRDNGWRTQALTKLIGRFPAGQEGRERTLENLRLYVQAAQNIPQDQWEDFADRLVMGHQFLPDPKGFAEACRAFVGARATERVKATWGLGDLHANPALAQFAVRDWLVDRYAWSAPMVPEPTDEDWPQAFAEVREAEFERALKLVAAGNPKDGTGAALPIRYTRLIALGEALGRAAAARHACRQNGQPDAPDGPRRSFADMAAECQRADGRPMPGAIRSLVARADETATGGA